jgi:PAS domain-containing protein
MLDRSSPMPQWISDAATTLIVDANEAALRFWRYTREQFIGMPATRLLFEEEVPRSEEMRRKNQWGETGP